MRRVVSMLVVLAVAAPARAQLPSRVDRRVEARIQNGFAEVRLELAITGEAGEEAAFEAPIPHGAGLATLLVCRAGACRRGVVHTGDRFGNTPGGARGAPEASVSQHRDVLSIRARPLDPRRPTVLTIRLTAPTDLIDGRDGITLPAHALGTTRVRLRAPGLSDPRVGARPARGEIEVEGEARLDAAIAPGAVRSVALAARCGDERCVRYRVASGALPGGPRDVFLLLDASPSARVAEPAHRARALRALLDALPPGSSVRRVAFAWRARRIDHVPLAPEDVDVGAGLPSDLGPATRVSGAWALVEDEVRSARMPLVVVVGDATLGFWTTERRALDAIVAAGAELSAVDLLGRAPTSTLATAVTRSDGMWARVPTEASLGALRFLARPLLAPSVRVGEDVLGPLRAGQELTLDDVTRELPAVLRAGADTRRVRGLGRPWDAGLGVAMALAHGRHDPRASLSAVAPPPPVRPVRGGGRRLMARRVARVPRIRVCTAQVRGSVSREALARVRGQLAPRVRACFAAQRRRGRRDRIRAELELLTAHGEVFLSRADADDPALARCLEEAPSGLGELPAPDEPSSYSSFVEVHFPFVSEAVPAPRAEPLRADVAALVDAL